MKQTHDQQAHDSIRALLQSLLEQKGDCAPFTDQDSLVASGRLDSLNVIEVISFLENNFNADFADDGFDQRDFDSVDAILNRVAG